MAVLAIDPGPEKSGWILALDPGPKETGWVVFDGACVLHAGISPNVEVIADLPTQSRCEILAIEMVSSYRMPVGREVFETCVWIGRFVQAWARPDEVRLVYRRDVKLELCGTARAKDANVRQALIDRIGPQGRKKDPGPTYGVKGHAWAALAVAVFATQKPEAA